MLSADILEHKAEHWHTKNQQPNLIDYISAGIFASLVPYVITKNYPHLIFESFCHYVLDTNPMINIIDSLNMVTN